LLAKKATDTVAAVAAWAGSYGAAAAATTAAADDAATRKAALEGMAPADPTLASPIAPKTEEAVVVPAPNTAGDPTGVVAGFQPAVAAGLMGQWVHIHQDGYCVTMLSKSGGLLKSLPCDGRPEQYWQLTATGSFESQVPAFLAHRVFTTCLPVCHVRTTYLGFFLALTTCLLTTCLPGLPLDPTNLRCKRRSSRG
jgi:hypothetical protein